LRESIDEPGHGNHFAEQDVTAPRLGMRRESFERPAERRIVGKADRAVAQPAVEGRLDGGNVGRELGVKSRRVADQIARVDLEEAGEQLPRLVRKMAAAPLFNQRQI
jgi:hypothetical protein